MKLTETRAREERRTQAAPISLEHGRFEPGQVVQLFGIALAALAAGAAGGALLSWGVAGTGSRWGWLADLSTWVAVFGALVAGLGFALALAVTILAARGWWRHQARQDDWHYAQLAAYESAGGQESYREVTHRSLTCTEPGHALLVVLAVARRARAGESTPWSAPKLAGPVWYGQTRLGDISKPEAEEFGRFLAEVGALTGRTKGRAGQLVTTDPGELVDLVARNYGKYVPGRIERPEPDEGE